MKKRLTKKDLERQIIELKGQLCSSYVFADKEITRASTKYLQGSACMVSIYALGGKEIMAPVAIRDGLSKETVDAIKRDLKRSYDEATLFKL